MIPPINDFNIWPRIVKLSSILNLGINLIINRFTNGNDNTKTIQINGVYENSFFADYLVNDLLEAYEIISQY